MEQLQKKFGVRLEELTQMPYGKEVNIIHLAGVCWYFVEQQGYSYEIINLYETYNMQEKLTILISSEHKNFIKRHARRQNKSVSKFIDDLLSSIKRQASSQAVKDEWVEKTAGAYSSGKKDVLKELFKGISRRTKFSLMPIL